MEKTFQSDKIEQNSDIDIISDYSFKLALCEVSIGSLLHGLHIPFSGQVLSLNQILFMTLVTREFDGKGRPARASLYVSQISAFLKSLSPAGKKLGPMLSISMQGLLFVLPQYILSTHIFSIMTGALLSSFWAFFQPLITLYIMFGSNLLKAFEYYSLKLQVFFNITDNSLWLVLLVPVLIKALLAMSLAFWAYKTENEGFVSKGLLFIMSRGERLKNKGRGGRAPSLLREVTRPIFLISILLTSFYIYSNREVFGHSVWLYLRPIAVCFILLYINRSKFILKYIDKNQNKTFFKVLKNVNLKLEKLSI